MTKKIERPKSLKIAAERILAGVDYRTALKEWKDELFFVRLEERSSFLTDEPELTGDPVIDVYIAGLAEYFSVQADQEPPEWTNAPARFLRKPVLFGGEHSRAWISAETPSAFRRRLLFCGKVRNE